MDLEKKIENLEKEFELARTGDQNELKKLYENWIKELEEQLAKQKQEHRNTISSLKDQYDKRF